MIAAVSLSFTIFQYPLVDYDEATYAKVVVDTLKSGDILSLSKSGSNWFEKPPLYLWLAMSFVKIFGEKEFAFRLPSVIASILCLWLVYLIVKELSGSRTVGAFAFLVLLFTPPFFVFAREARLDSGVIMAILAALFYYIKGWQNEKFLFWIFPAIAAGFLFKSVIVFLIFPIVFIYSIFYRQWLWMKSKYLWTGFLASLVILIPWHALEFFRFGSIFWNEYFLHQVFQRGVSTITGTNNYYDYVKILWLYYNPWLWAFVAAVLLFVSASLSKKLRPKIAWKQVFPPALTALLIIVLFSLARTHLSTYIMPAFPFLAMFIALSLYYFSLLFNRETYVLPIILLVFVSVGSLKSFALIGSLVAPIHYEERELGRIFKSQSEKPVLLYALDWPHHETLSYYGDTRLRYLDPRTEGGKELKAPFYLVTTTLALTFFINNQGVPYSGYESLRGLYLGKYLVLIYSDKDVNLPVFVKR